MHTAKIIKDDSFGERNKPEHLGQNGIAFSVICCDDPKTISRHTIHNEITPDELDHVIARHLKESAQAHQRTENHMKHLHKILGTHQLEDCGCGE